MTPTKDIEMQEMPTSSTIHITDMLQSISSGLLGATSFGPHAAAMVKEERLRMIEKRILRIEMLLRSAGMEPESLPLPE